MLNLIRILADRMDPRRPLRFLALVLAVLWAGPLLGWIRHGQIAWLQTTAISLAVCCAFALWRGGEALRRRRAKMRRPPLDLG